MAAKSSLTEYTVRKNPKISDSTGKRTQKPKNYEPTASTLKKTTRAKTRVLDDGLVKGREKGKISSECVVEDSSVFVKKEVTAESINMPKRDSDQMKKDSLTSVLPKKDLICPGKKDLCHSRKETENVDTKKEIITSAVPKKEIEVLTYKSRKSKLKMGNNCSDKKSEHKNPETKLDLSTNEKFKVRDDKIKSEKKEGTSKPGERSEIMNSDVSSSMDVPNKNSRYNSPSLVPSAKDGIWKQGDIAWGRVGQHPFWPCMIVNDQEIGEYSKTKRVGRGLKSVQQSLHVQFFGDKGRHSWIPGTCVMRYEGKEVFLKFCDKVIKEMKKKNRKVTSAFIVKPASKQRWEIAIKEAEETVPKTREDRLIYFQELLPKRVSKASEKSEKKSSGGYETKLVQTSKKTKRSSLCNEGTPSKLMKSDGVQIASKPHIEEKINTDTQSFKVSGRNKKQTGELDVSGTSSPTKCPPLGLFLRRNIRKMQRQ